ncbi:MAG: site-specific integrase [Actinomycetota bacterium]|nr:site-specific integrase [Actinomycetota bacterium]
MSGPLELYASGFAAELVRLGFTRNTIACQLRLMAHVSSWLAGKELEAGLTAAVVEEFFAFRRAAGHATLRSPRALEPLLAHLRELGVVQPAVAVAATPAEGLLERYRCYLLDERGLAAGTVRGYVDIVRSFVVGRGAADGSGLEGLTAGDLSAYVLAECPRRSRGSAKLLVCALRSLLGFLHVEGVLAESLSGAVPSVAGWRLAGLPRGLEPGQARRLLSSCDRRTTAGRRDFAILTLLLRLGLRRGEVARLELGDVDWRAGEVLIRGKGDRQERLPLPADVGEAVAGYLRRGRPGSAQGRCVFVRAKAPRQPLTPGGVTQVVVSAGKRAGLGEIGAHRLRHTAATEMLRAGATLPEVGQVLRHRSLLTTAIYAKVDREALRTIARPWIGGAA